MSIKDMQNSGYMRPQTQQKNLQIDQANIIKSNLVKRSNLRIANATTTIQNQTNTRGFYNSKRSNPTLNITLLPGKNVSRNNLLAQNANIANTMSLPNLKQNLRGETIKIMQNNSESEQAQTQYQSTTNITRGFATQKQSIVSTSDKQQSLPYAGTPDGLGGQAWNDPSVAFAVRDSGEVIQRNKTGKGQPREASLQKFRSNLCAAKSQEQLGIKVRPRNTNITPSRIYGTNSSSQLNSTLSNLKNQRTIDYSDQKLPQQLDHSKRYASHKTFYNPKPVHQTITIRPPNVTPARPRPTKPATTSHAPMKPTIPKKEQAPIQSSIEQLSFNLKKSSLHKQRQNKQTSKSPYDSKHASNKSSMVLMRNLLNKTLDIQVNDTSKKVNDQVTLDEVKAQLTTGEQLRVTSRIQSLKDLGPEVLGYFYQEQKSHEINFEKERLAAQQERERMRMIQEMWALVERQGKGRGRNPGIGNFIKMMMNTKK